MKTILIPTDFSDYSKNAAVFALHIASECGYNIHLFHCYHIPAVDPMMPGEMIGDLSESIKKDSTSQLEELKKQLTDYARAINISVEIETSNRIGFAVEEVTEVANEMNPVLVVIGSRHRNGLQKFLSGSIIKPLLDHLQHTVLIVPENRAFKDSKPKVLYATDFNEADADSLNKLIAFFKPFGAHIECLHIDTDNTPHIGEFELSELERKFKDKAADDTIHFDIIRADDAKEGIQAYIQKNDIDVLSTFSKKRNFFQKLVDTSLSKQIAVESDIPLIVFK
jgi:nucleotide-binding universal stress UspA family protein